MGSKKSSNKGLLIYVLVLVGVMILIVTLMKQSTKTASEYTYSEIMGYFDSYQVSEFDFDLGSGKLNMTVNNPDGTAQEISYTVPNVTVFLNEIQTGSENYRREYNKLHPDAPLVMEYYKIQDTSWLYNLLPSLVIIIMMVALFVFMMRQMGGGGKINSFSKANVKNTSNKKNTFADVAGADEEKAELAEIVDFLKNPRKYNDIGARIPKGVLLMGPPGTGKTLLAKAVAGEAGVPFFSISGSDFVELYVGVGASRVRDLFETAKKNAPAIIFIDEIDAVGRHRGAGLGGGHDEREQTLNQLLVEMDGFEGNEGVIVIAATNRRDILDPALLRPGRFDRQITVSYPDIKGREEILKVHTKKKPLAPDVSLPTIAKSTAGFTGADLENLVNEAALLAARQDRKAITKADIEEATIKVIAGPEKKSKVVTPDERRLVAYHEAGHAVVTFMLPTQDKVHQVTIIPRGSAGGMTIHLPEREPSLLRVTGEKLKDEIKVCMGGRVAEELILGIGSAGAISDLQRSTKLAKAMVTKYGFSKKLGPVVYGDDNDEPFVGMGYGQSKGISEKVQAEIDEEVRSIIDECYDGTVKILNDNIDKLHLVAKALIVHEKLDNDEFEKIMKGETTAETVEAEYEEFISSEKEKEEKAASEDKADTENAPSDNNGGSDGSGCAPYVQSYNNIRSFLADKFDGKMSTFAEKVSDKIKNDIAVIAPTEKHPYYVLCTLGMSELPMTTPEDMPEEDAAKRRRAEVMMLLPPDWKMSDEAFKDEKWYWPVRTLKTTASYVHDEKTWIGHGHDVQFTVDCKPFADNTDYCALMFSSVKNNALNGFTDADGNYINIYCAIPVYKEELEEKITDETSGGDKLYSKIYGDNCSLEKLVVDLNRKNVCK